MGEGSESPAGGRKRLPPSRPPPGPNSHPNVPPRVWVPAIPTFTQILDSLSVNEYFSKLRSHLLLFLYCL